MKVNLTKTDLSKIERWARAYMKSRPGKICFWDLHGNDSLTYNKICKYLKMEGLKIGRVEV